MSISLRFALLGGVVLGGACKTEAGEPELSDIERLLPAACEVVAECRCASDLESDCLQARTEQWEERFAEGEERELTYDPECFERIMTAMTDARCGDFEDSNAHPCEDFCSVFYGDVEAGKECEGDTLVSDCASDLVCDNRPFLGVCRPACEVLTGRQPGENCASEDGGQFEECAQGLHCSLSSLVCEASPAVGSPCRDFQCGGDLVCDQFNRCVAGGGVGADCFDLPCQEDLVCEYNGNTGGATCRQPAGVGQDCFNTQCQEDLRCDFNTNRCRALPAAGTACLNGDCAEGAACDFNTNLCLAPPALGQACPAGECQPGLYCDTLTDPMFPVCLTDKEVDDRCNGHNECLTGYCPNGFCWERPRLGEGCANLFICANGLVCNGGICTDATARGPMVCGYDGW